MRDPGRDDIPLSDGFGDDVTKRGVGGHRDGHRQRSPQRAGRLGGGIEEHAEARTIEQFRLRALIKHGEARGDVGLERELLQQARAEGVDGLNLEAAGRLQRRGEEPAGKRAPRRIDAACADLGKRRSSSASSRAIHALKVSNTRLAMLAAAALVNVMQRIFAGSTPSSSSLMTRCAKTWVLPAPALAATKAETLGSEASIC